MLKNEPGIVSVMSVVTVMGVVSVIRGVDHVLKNCAALSALRVM